MNEQLFRKKSIEKVSSPEQLDTYIRVSNPGVWLLLIAILVLLVGICVWGVMGHLDTTVDTVAVVENGQTTIYIKEADIQAVTVGTPVKLAETEGAITQITARPIVVDDTFLAYACHVGGLQQGEWVYVATVSATVADGIYTARIVTESVAPMSFVVN